LAGARSGMHFSHITAKSGGCRKAAKAAKAAKTAKTANTSPWRACWARCEGSIPAAQDALRGQGTLGSEGIFGWPPAIDALRGQGTFGSEGIYGPTAVPWAASRMRGAHGSRPPRRPDIGSKAHHQAFQRFALLRLT